MDCLFVQKLDFRVWEIDLERVRSFIKLCKRIICLVLGVLDVGFDFELDGCL